MNTATSEHKETLRTFKRITRALGATVCGALGMLVSSCYLDELTAPPADESAIEFAVSGDSVLLLGDSLQLSAAFDVGKGAGVTRITWVSNDTTVARVDEVRGMVRGVGAGSTRISAYLVAPDLDNDLLRTWPMEVQYAGIGMVNDSLTGLGESRTLEARGLDVLGGMHEVVSATFWTADDSIISLDSTGVVVALRNGLAMVNASWGEFTTEAPILVRQVAGRIVVGTPSLRLPVLQSDTTVSVQVRDTEDSLIIAPVLTWVSSSPANISVTPAGVIRALQRGTSTITVSSDTASATIVASVAPVVKTLQVNDGGNQTAPVDTPVPTAPSVVARDANGNLIEGALITFSVDSGGGSVVDSVRVTNAQGIARVGSWILGRTAGANVLRASADSATVTLQAIGTPGATSTETSTVTAMPDTIPAGTSAVLKLQARDAFGNVITTGGRTVSFSASGGTSTGTISATTDNGDGTYTATFSGETAGSATTVDATVDAVAVTTTAATVTVVPGPAAQMSRQAGEGQSAGVGSAVFIAPAVKVTDAFDNAVEGASVTFAVTSGGGSVSGASATTDANGIATVGSWTVGSTPGPNTLTASAAGVSSVVFSANAVSNVPSELTSVVTVSVDTLPAGTVSTLTLQSKDSGGNDVTVGGFTVMFTASGGTSTGSISSTTDNGDGTYTATFSGELAGTATTIGATINGAAVTTPLPTITVVPGAISAITSVITTSVANLVAGTNAILTLNAKDAFGNNITTGGANVTFNLSGGTSTGTLSATTDNGDGTYTATLNGQFAGTAVSVGATIDGTAVTSTLPTITVIPGAVSPGTSQVTTSLATMSTGTNAVFTLIAKDGLGNNLTSGGSTVVFNLSGGTSAGAIGATVDNGNGTYTATFTAQVSGTAATVGATIDGAGVTSTLPTITVVPGSASTATSVVSVSVASVAAGGNATFTLVTKDAFGNDLTTGGLTVAFNLSGGTSGGTIGGVVDNGDGSYEATFTGEISGSAATVGATIDGSAVTSTLPTITVVPGAVSTATSVVSTSGPTVVAGANGILTLTTKDAYGNSLTSGGHTVAFSLSGGTSTGNIGATVDNGDGSYTATVTGQTAGSAVTVGATIDGNAVTSTLPSITVVPGAVSTATSMVSTSASTIAAGSNATLTLVTKDALGNDLATGGHTVAFSLSGGTSTGAIGPTTDNGNGSYTATLTGQVAGSAATVNATIDGNAVSSTLPTVTVVPGPVSLATSTVTVSADTVMSDSVITLTLTTRDAFSNPLATGGHTVVFSTSGGSSTGTIGTTTDVGDGTYTASFTGLVAGSATNISAMIDGQAITSSLPSVTVIPGVAANISVNAGDGQTAQVSTSVAVPPSALVTDNQGNPVAGVSVTFSVTLGGGSVAPVAPISTDAGGFATVTTWTLGAAPGTNQLTATASGVPGSAVFTATASTSAPITLEEYVTMGSVDTIQTFPAIGGGTNQTYVMFSTSLSTTDIDSVIGGGLTWTERIEQCGGSQDHWNRIWTAQGSPGAPFQLQIFPDTTGGNKKNSAVLARYSNVSGFEGVVGNSNIGGSPCTGPSPQNTEATLSVTSTVADAVHLIAVGIKTDSLTSHTAGYVEIARKIGGGDNLKVFIFSRGVSTPTTDNFSATIVVPRRWTTTGIVLKPN